jgi:hypothetical protein
MSSLLVPSHTILVQFTGQVSHSITAKQGRFLAKMLCYTGYGGVEAMNRRAFLARVFTVAAATSTFALGPIPDFRKPLRACPYCGYKGNSVLGGRNAYNDRVHHDSIQCRRCPGIYIKDGPRRDESSGALIP